MPMVGQLAGIAGMVLVVAVLSVGTLAPLLLFGAVMIRDDGDWRPRARWWVASSVLAFVSIVLGVWLIGHTGTDEAAHCGPGTRYVSQDHLVGKTIEHDWECIA